MTRSPDAWAPMRLKPYLCRDRRFDATEWLRHGITSRLQTTEPGEGNVGYGPPRDRDAAWRMRSLWCQAAGVSPERLVGLNQVHGARVLVADTSHAGSGAEPDNASAGEADGLITNTPGLPLMTLHADCQPILFIDPVRRAVGVSHAGWRGAVSDVAGSTVRAMVANFDSRPHDLLVYLGPAIAVDCYEVGEEVVQAWTNAYAGPNGVDAVKLNHAGYQFNLTVANRLQLQRAGIPRGNVSESGVCTRCQGATWFSHRGQGPGAGRFAAIIGIAGDGKS